MLSASLLRYAVGFERQGRAAVKSGFGQYCSLWLAARGPWLVARGSWQRYPASFSQGDTVNGAHRISGQPSRYARVALHYRYRDNARCRTNKAC